MKFPVINTGQEFDENIKSGIWVKAAEQICGRHGISYFALKRPAYSEHIIFLVDDAFIIKIFSPFRNCFKREKTGLEFAFGKTSLQIPEIVATGRFEDFDYMIMTQIPGELMTREIWVTLPEKEQISVVTQLAAGLKELHSHDARSLEFDWSNFVEQQSKIALDRQIAARINPEWLEELPDFIDTNLKLLPKDCPTVFLHSDVHFGNLRFQNLNGRWQVCGLFDFADSLCGFHEFDLLAPTLLMIQGQGAIQREFFKAYGYSEKDLDEPFRKRLMLMTILYECSDLRRYALRLKPEAVNFSLEELERAIWNFTK